MSQPVQEYTQGYLVKIEARDLAVGMYVQELDRPWTDTPFLFQGFRIKNTQEIAEINEHCEYVYIDTEQGVDAPDNNQCHIEDDNSVVSKVREIAGEFCEKGIYSDSVPVEQELEVARDIFEKSYIQIENTFAALRKDGMVSVDDIRETSNTIVASVLRNPDAFILLQKIKERDSYSHSHAINCCVLAATFCRHLGYTEEEIKDIALGALMLDVGIVKLPTSILEKQGPLNPISLKLIRHHVGFSMDMVKQIPGLPGVVHDMILTHHERVNGKGYPQGIKNSEIPASGRIAAIVDCYDAMISKRPYKKSLTPSEAVCELYKWRGIDFHEDLVEKFIQCLGAYPTGTLVELNSGQIGIIISQNRLHRLYPKILLILNPDKVRYEKQRIIDLWEFEKKSKGKVLDIIRTVDADKYGIDPAYYYL